MDAVFPTCVSGCTVFPDVTSVRWRAAGGCANVLKALHLSLMYEHIKERYSILSHDVLHAFSSVFVGLMATICQGN